MKHYSNFQIILILFLVCLGMPHETFSQVIYQHQFSTGTPPKYISATSDSGYITCSYFGTTNGNLIVSKIDSLGVEEWNNIYDPTLCGMYNGTPRVLPVSSGGYYLSGTSEDCFAGLKSWFITRLDGSGNVLWNVSDESSSGGFWHRQDLYHLEVDPYTDDVCMTGWNYIYDDNNFVDVAYNTYFNRYDSTGMKTLSVKYDPFPVTGDKLRYTTFFHDSLNLVSEYIAFSGNKVFKFDPAGNVIWMKSYHNPVSGFSFIQAAKVGRHYYFLSNVQNKAAILRTDSAGNIIDDVLIDLISEATNIYGYDDKSILVMGIRSGAVSSSPVNILVDTSLVFIKANYTSQSVILFNGPSAFEKNTRAIYRTYGGAGNIWNVERMFMDQSCGFADTVVSLSSLPSVSDSAFTESFAVYNESGSVSHTVTPGQIVYNVLCGPVSTGIHQPGDWKPVSVFPNPTDGVFKLDLGDNIDKLNVVIRDVSGRQVLSEKYLSVNEIELMINAPAGVYFGELYSGDKLEGRFKVISTGTYR